MRKLKKKMALELVHTLHQVHGNIKNMVDKQETAQAMELLELCQQGAIQLGDLIEKEEGDHFVTIGMLEEYCETVYRLYENLRDEESHGKSYKLLHKQLIQIENSIKYDIKQRTEVVFLPYKASMWDSLESVWKSANEDENCDVYVIPIPYFEKNPDGSFRQMHYEGDQYPSYVSVINYEKYNFEERKPDMVFIHNPYDECNYVTSIHPFFYSKNLKQYTDNLIYIPYFILDEILPEDHEAVDKIEHFCTLPGIVNADKVIVQSNAMRQIYINVMSRFTGQNTRSYWESKILGLGSPKVEKVFNTNREDITLPDEWLNLIQRPDGSFKKIVFYNTGLSALLQYNEKMLTKMKEVFQTFKERCNEVTLLWRPHPLIKETIESMRPQLWLEYLKLEEQYRKEGWGIYDNSADLDRAIIVSDAYYGDSSSVVQLYEKTGKIIMLQNVYSLKENNNSLAMDNIVDYKGNWWFLGLKDNGLYRMEKDSLTALLISVIPCEQRETVQQYGKIYIYNDKIFAIPWSAKRIAIYDLKNKEFRFIEYKGQANDSGMVFLKGIMKGNRLYLIPCSYGHLLYIDMDKEMVHIVEDSLSSINTTSTPNGFAWGEVFDENDWVIFTMLTDNKVIQVNLNSGEKEIYDIELLNTGGAGVCGDSKGIWLVPSKADSILYWDRAKKQSYIYNNFPEGYQSGDLSFYKLYLDNGTLYLLPRDANMLLSVDRNGYIRNILQQEETIDENHVLDRYMRYSNIWRSGNDIYFISAMKGNLYIIDENGNLEKKEIKSFKNIDTVLDEDNCSLVIEKENSLESLENFIDIVRVKKDINKNKHINMENSIGKNILKIMLNE